MAVGSPENSRLTRTAMRTVTLVLVWALLTRGDLQSWVVGVPTVVAACAAATALAAKSSLGWNPIAAIVFLGRFSLWSIIGGVDVAWRSIDPRLPIHPRFLSYTTRLPDGPARVLFMNVISLLPGTLTADEVGETLTVHALDGSRPITEQLRRVERALAAVFDVQLEETGSQAE